jgi:hypothetical protein
MVHIDIPTKLEEEIKNKQQKEYCERLLVGIDEEIVKAYEKKREKIKKQPCEAETESLPETTAENLSDKIKKAFRSELNRRNEAYLGAANYDPARFAPATKSRPTAGLIDRRGKLVETTQQFALFLEAAADVRKVTTYAGPEEMFAIKIPEGYIGKVAYVQRQDIDQTVYDAGRVISLRREKDGQYMDIVPSLDAIRTDQAFGTLTEQQVHQKYGWVTVKIKDGCMASWMVGPDIRGLPANSPGEQWALLGPHKKKR